MTPIWLGSSARPPPCDGLVDKQRRDVAAIQPHPRDGAVVAAPDALEADLAALEQRDRLARRGLAERELGTAFRIAGLRLRRVDPRDPDALAARQPEGIAVRDPRDAAASIPAAAARAA